MFIQSNNKKARSIIDREILILKKMDHPNIIKLLNYKIKETSVCLVLEYLEYDLY